MKFLLKLATVVIAVIVCFVVYSSLGIFYISGGVICLVVLGFIPHSSKDEENKLEPLSPSKQTGSYVSSAWLGAKMDEEEERRKQGEKEPRDQGINISELQNDS